MAALLRLAETSPLALAFASGVPLFEADMFVLTLQGGQVFYCTSWPVDLTVGGQVYSSRNPWLECKSWNVSNTMEVPEMQVLLRALDTPWNGGASIKAQIHNGLLDGASILYSAVYMTTPGATAALGSLPLFGGVISGIDLTGTTATIDFRAKTNLLDQMAPRTLYQTQCNHAFCDIGCTLNKATYTASFVVGSSGLSASFIPWAAAPGNPTAYQGGSITMTSGAASGETADIGQATSAGLALDYPLYATPAPGDTFTAVQGCSKAFNDGSGQSCTDRANTQNFLGYPYVPPPNSAY